MFPQKPQQGKIWNTSCWEYCPVKGLLTVSHAPQTPWLLSHLFPDVPHAMRDRDIRPGLVILAHLGTTLAGHLAPEPLLQGLSPRLSLSLHGALGFCLLCFFLLHRCSSQGTPSQTPCTANLHLGICFPGES